jgi:hypothetical protein
MVVVVFYFIMTLATRRYKESFSLCPKHLTVVDFSLVFLDRVKVKVTLEQAMKTQRGSQMVVCG